MTSNINPDELRKLAEEATPGPWEPMKGAEEGDEMRCAVVAQRGNLAYLVATIENGAPGDFCDTEYANAQLLAYLRNNVPTILSQADEIARLTASEAVMREALAKCRNQFSFYATEHRSAEKYEKAMTNQGFADLCAAALSLPHAAREDGHDA